MTPLRQRGALYVAGTLALLGLWYFLAFTPTFARLNSVRGEVDGALRQLADYNRTIQELPEFLKVNDNLQVMRHRLNSSLYAKSEILDLFHQLTTDAQDHNLQLVQISPPVSELLELNRQASVDNSPLFLSVTLDFRGNFLDFGRFVSNLETKPYFRSVKNCVLRDSQTSQYTIDMSLSFKALIGTTEVSS